MDRLVKFFLIICLFTLINCQNKKEKVMIENSYNVQICHPDNTMDITPVIDKIITLEGIPASLPYGSSSGEWGDSGKYFTDQHGTPIGADIVYYSGYENTFYHLKAKFPIDTMKDLAQRAYATHESDSDKPLKEYINRKEEPNYETVYNKLSTVYDRMTDLVFGFAPNGMVVVWVGYSGVQIEVGRYEAEVIKDKTEISQYEKKYLTTYRLAKEYFDKAATKYLLPNASPLQWDNYRIKYSWKPEITSTHPKFRLQQSYFHYYNGEYEIMLRPWILNPETRERAIPKSMVFYWETGKDEGFQGEIYFNWDEANEIFKKAGENGKLNIKIAPDNSSIEVLINNEVLKVDSTRVFKNETKYKESYH